MAKWMNDNLKRKALIMLCTLAMHWCGSERFWRKWIKIALIPAIYCLQITRVVLNQIVEKAEPKP